MCMFFFPQWHCHCASFESRMSFHKFCSLGIFGRRGGGGGRSSDSGVIAAKIVCLALIYILCTVLWWATASWEKYGNEEFLNLLITKLYSIFLLLQSPSTKCESTY